MNNMEQQQGNQELPMLCRASCGFYGNPAFDGLCSKCYKDKIKNKQQDPTTVTSSGRASPSQGGRPQSAEAGSSSGAEARVTSPPAVTSQTTPSVETAAPTVLTPADKDEAEASGSAVCASSSETDTSPDSPSKDGAKKKKNRCHNCKKKVGLTGFQCRCGGLFCSLHRYSDKHDCTFNYREHGQAQIRKANPVVVGEKIQKI